MYCQLSRLKTLDFNFWWEGYRRSDSGASVRGSTVDAFSAIIPLGVVSDGLKGGSLRLVGQDLWQSKFNGRG